MLWNNYSSIYNFVQSDLDELQFKLQLLVSREILRAEVPICQLLPLIPQLKFIARSLITQLHGSYSLKSIFLVELLIYLI